MLLQLASLFTAISAFLAVPQPTLVKPGGQLAPINPAPPLSAASVFLVDTTAGTILHAKQADVSHPLASITKLMTALALLDRVKDSPSGERLSFDRYITFEARDRRNGGVAYLIAGEQLQTRDVWNLMLVASSNDAAALLARDVFGSEEAAVFAMNAKARALGLGRLKFADSTGLSPENVGTAREVAALARVALAHPEIRASVGLRQARIVPQGKAERLVRSTNWLVGEPIVPGARYFGGKTGHIEASGYNLVLAVGSRAHELVGVVLGAESNAARFREMRGLMAWGFENAK